ncbi:MAG: patatin-like phospholipase family protein [Candidatus Vecturithrix sp.]|nr:patatin-like phospholipase family protein [Candidatus Vecturithrix sp.]
MSPKDPSPRIALVLGSGGIKCLAGIGLLKVLHRQHIIPDVIVGSSGGSLFGAVYAAGEHPDTIEQQVLKMWQKKEFRDIKYFDILKMFLPKVLRYDEMFGLVRGDRIEEIFCTYFGDITFETTKIPLQIVATDFFTGEEVVLEHGSLAEAVRASIGIPVFFQPKKIAGKILIDGGVSNPLPINVAIRYGADIIIAMGFESPTYQKIDSPIKTLLHLTGISMNNLLIANYAVHNLAHHYEIIMISPPLNNEFHFFDIHRIPEIIAIGEREANAELPNIQSAIDHFGLDK